MRRGTLVLLFVSCVTVACLAQAQKAERSRSAGEKELLSPLPSVAKVQLSKDQEFQIAQTRQKLLAAPVTPCSTPIAVSVQGQGHFTAGMNVLLTYPPPITDVGGAWSSMSTFVAPCSGLFYFNITFVKDAYYHGGTEDDVTVMLVKNGTQYIGQAWSGEGAGKRGTGAYGVTLLLQQAEYVQTVVHSDGGAMRHLANYNFTGFSIH